MRPPSRIRLGAAAKVAFVFAGVAALLWLAGMATAFAGDCKPNRPAERGSAAGGLDTSVSAWPPGERCVEVKSEGGEEYIRQPGPALAAGVVVFGLLAAISLLAGIAAEIVSLLRMRT